MEERKLDMENLKTVSDEKEEHSVLEKKIGRTRYHVHLFFDPNSKETMQQKIMRMMKNETGFYGNAEYREGLSTGNL